MNEKYISGWITGSMLNTMTITVLREQIDQRVPISIALFAR